MGNLVLIDEDDLKKLIIICLEEFFKETGTGNIIASNEADETLITSLAQIAKLCHCSFPTAQKIKDAIPKDQYLQVDKTFAIKKSILLKTNNQRNK